MKHFREDYQDRIVDLAGIISCDEPVFVIRGQDLAGATAVRAWADCTEGLGGDNSAICEHAREVARHMEAWAQEHGGKVADLPDEESTSAPDESAAAAAPAAEVEANQTDV